MPEWLVVIASVGTAWVSVLVAVGVYQRQSSRSHELDQIRRRLDEWREAALAAREAEALLARRFEWLQRDLVDLTMKVQRRQQVEEGPRRAVAIGSITGPTPAQHTEEQVHVSE